MTRTRFQVAGMTCAHCVSSVTAAVTALPGVTAAQVDLATGTLEVTTDDGPADDTAVSAAVDEAGYTVTGTRS
jgi:copper chaperone